MKIEPPTQTNLTAEQILGTVEPWSSPAAVRRLIALWTETIATLEARERTPDEEQKLTFARWRLDDLHRQRMAEE